MAEQNLRALKTLVISMGIVLVVGFFVVIAAVWMKMKNPGALTASAACTGGEVDLKGRGQLVDTSYSGNTLRVITAKPTGEVEVSQIDLCNGKQISTLKLSTDNAGAMP